MRLALVGGTGKEGKGLAIRWARARHQVFIGSRDGERGREAAHELSAQTGTSIEGGDNPWAVTRGDVVVVAVPYAAHRTTLESLRDALEEKIVIDITVPLKPPKVREVHLPEGQAAALEALEVLPSTAKLVAALHHISSVHLQDPDHEFDCDAMFCTDHASVRETVATLLRDLGMRPIDAGGLRNAIALESLTPVLLHINKKYGAPGVGLRVTGLSIT